MRKASIGMLLLALAVATLASPPAAAQSEPMMSTPPKVLEIIREEVKPGKAYAHTAHEAQWTRAMVQAKYDTPLLAITATTGANEAWFLVGFGSFDEFEKQGDRMMKNASTRNIMESNTGREADFLQDSRTMIAVFRPELSYKPSADIGGARYFNVRTTRVRMGESFADLMKVVNDARDRAGYNYPVAVYEVVSGGPTGTFLSFHAMKSLAEMDEAAPQAYSDALRDANFGSLAGKVVMTTEPRVFEFSPAMSNPRKEWVAANPGFWKPPMMKAKAEMPAAKKEAEKK